MKESVQFALQTYFFAFVIAMIMAAVIKVIRIVVQRLSAEEKQDRDVPKESEV